MFIQISDNLKQLSTFFPENLYIVGGYVRNKLMGIDESDVDITSSVDIEEVSKRLKESQFSVKIKSLKFGSLLISKDGEEYEYTVFRKDIYEDDGRHAPTRVERTDSIVVDSNRRDFAINAIYYNINKDEIVDIHHGMVDLFQRIIRCDKPDEVLKYDGERILRMVRIAGELDFRIDKQTLACAEKYASNIKAISGNRKKLEIENAANVPGADRGQIEDERLARVKELREMKKELKEAGIECATMNAAETQAAYAQLKNTDNEKGE